MRIKTILSLIAFSAAFVSSVLLIGLPQDNFYSRFDQARTFRQNRQVIKTFLWEDINNGRSRDQILLSLDGYDKDFQTSYNVIQIADATEDYVDASQSMDSSDLPADLQQAWQAHINAWRKHADYVNEVKTIAEKYSTPESKDGKMNGFLFYLNNGNKYNIQAAEINRTYDEVLRIAGKYGVYISAD